MDDRSEQLAQPLCDLPSDLRTGAGPAPVLGGVGAARVPQLRAHRDSLQNRSRAEECERDEEQILARVPAPGPPAVGSDVVRFGRDSERLQMRARQAGRLGEFGRVMVAEAI